MNVQDNPNETDFIDDDVLIATQILEANQIKGDVINQYRTYNPTMRGCNALDPIVITDTDNYVHLEYKIVEALAKAANRNVEFCFDRQRFSITPEGRKMDILEFEVFDIEDFEDNEEDTEDPDEFSHQETYYFDITAGYDKLLRQLLNRE